MVQKNKKRKINIALYLHEKYPRVTQQSVANVLCLSRQHYQQYVSGQTKIPSELLPVLRRAFIVLIGKPISVRQFYSWFEGCHLA